MLTATRKSDFHEQHVISNEHRSVFYDQFYANLHEKTNRSGLFPGHHVSLINIFNDADKVELGYAGLGALRKAMADISSETSERTEGLAFLETAKVSATEAIVGKKVYSNFQKQNLQVVSGRLNAYFKNHKIELEDPKKLEETLTIRQIYGEYPILHSMFDIDNSAYLSIPLTYSGKKGDELAGVVHLVYEQTNGRPSPDAFQQNDIEYLCNLGKRTLDALLYEFNLPNPPSLFLSHI